MGFDYSSFIAVFPEFAEIESTSVIFVGDFAYDFLSKHAWGKWHERAVCLLTAHKLALKYDINATASSLGMNNPNGAQTIQLTRKAAVDSLSESGMASSLAKSDSPWIYDLSRTNYGIDLLELIELLMPASIVVYSPPIANLKLYGDRYFRI